MATHLNTTTHLLAERALLGVGGQQAHAPDPALPLGLAGHVEGVLGKVAVRLDVDGLGLARPAGLDVALVAGVIGESRAGSVAVVLQPHGDLVALALSHQS